jgi:hypothetical protein
MESRLFKGALSVRARGRTGMGPARAGGWKLWSREGAIRALSWRYGRRPCSATLAVRTKLEITYDWDPRLARLLQVHIPFAMVHVSERVVGIIIRIFLSSLF